MPGQITNRLPAGFVLTITATATSSGFYRRVEDSGSAETYSGTAVAVSTTATVGPFTTDRQYEVVSLVGTLGYSIAKADLGTTGTGDTVRATAATVASPLITQPITLAAADGAITISPGVVAVTKAGVAALTLAAPTSAQEGTQLVVTSRTANAHTITTVALLEDGVTGGGKNVATFAAFVGATVTLLAINLKWHVVALNAVTVA
jgi:hypothetical protein